MHRGTPPDLWRRRLVAQWDRGHKRHSDRSAMWPALCFSVICVTVALLCDWTGLAAFCYIPPLYRCHCNNTINVRKHVPSLGQHTDSGTWWSIMVLYVNFGHFFISLFKKMFLLRNKYRKRESYFLENKLKVLIHIPLWFRASVTYCTLWLFFIKISKTFLFVTICDYIFKLKFRIYNYILHSDLKYIHILVFNYTL